MFALIQNSGGRRQDNRYKSETRLVCMSAATEPDSAHSKILSKTTKSSPRPKVLKSYKSKCYLFLSIILKRSIREGLNSASQEKGMEHSELGQRISEDVQQGAWS